MQGVSQLPNCPPSSDSTSGSLDPPTGARQGWEGDLRSRSWRLRLTSVLLWTDELLTPLIIPAAKEGTTSSSKLPCRLNEVKHELHPAGHSSSFRTVRGWAGAASWPELGLVDRALQPLREQRNQDCGFHLERQWVSGQPLVFIYL